MGQHTDSFFFLHIPKTAGSSLRLYLEGIFPEETVLGGHGTGRYNLAQLWDIRDRLDGYRLYRGHYGYGFAELLATRPRIICMFRDPIARTLSHLKQIARHRGHWFFRTHPYTPDIDELIAQPAIRNAVANHQTRHLAAPRPEPLPGGGFAGLGEWLAQQEDWDDEAMFERATQRLRELAFVGLVESAELSMRLLARSFDWPERALATANAAPNANRREQHSAVLLDSLERINTLDMRLYRLARGIFKERCQALGVTE